MHIKVLKRRLGQVDLLKTIRYIGESCAMEDMAAFVGSIVLEPRSHERRAKLLKTSEIKHRETEFFIIKNAVLFYCKSMKQQPTYRVKIIQSI